MLTHSNIIANMRQVLRLGIVDREDVGVNIMPLYHAGGLHALTATLGIGATLVLMRRFDLETYLALSERYRPTLMSGPPPLILALTKSPPCLGGQG